LEGIEFEVGEDPPLEGNGRDPGGPAQNKWTVGGTETVLKRSVVIINVGTGKPDAGEVPEFRRLAR
jgi:hypothetical protein